MSLLKVQEFIQVFLLNNECATHVGVSPQKKKRLKRSNYTKESNVFL